MRRRRGKQKRIWKWEWNSKKIGGRWGNVGTGEGVVMNKNTFVKMCNVESF